MKRLALFVTSAGLHALLACADPPAAGDASDGDGEVEVEDDGEDEADDGSAVICMPGERRCADHNTLEECAATGLSWEPSPCADYETCEDAACVGPCERLAESPSSAGCSFYATSIWWSEAWIVSNPDPAAGVEVELREVPVGSNIEELVEGPLELGPGESHTFTFEPESTYEEAWPFPTKLRSGGVRHLVSNLPVVARRQIPAEATSHRAGGTLLVPEHMLTENYVIHGYPPYAFYDYYLEQLRISPSYFTVMALDDQTTVRWWPTAATAGDALPIQYVEAGGVGERVINRYDSLRIAASNKDEPPLCQQDLSGTVVVADKPVWVESAVIGTNVPFCPTEECASPLYPGDVCYFNTLDFMIEQNIAVEFWGMEYAAAHAPTRSESDRHVWRVFAGADGVKVDVEPPQPGWPVELDGRGDWVELVVDAGINLRFTGDGPFMPVQLVTSFFLADAGLGGPSMVQMVPTVQFLDRYVFFVQAFEDPEISATQIVQVIRRVGAAEVELDGVVIDAQWESFAGWAVAEVEVEAGTHVLESEDAFGGLYYVYFSKSVGEGVHSGAGAGWALGMRGAQLSVP